jgi:hypothetical protein
MKLGSLLLISTRFIRTILVAYTGRIHQEVYCAKRLLDMTDLRFVLWFVHVI